MNRPLYNRHLSAAHWLGKAIVAAWCACLLHGTGATATETARRSVLTTFEEGPGQWVQREWSDRGEPTTKPLETGPLPESLGETPALLLPLAFPGKQEFVTAAAQDWSGWDVLNIGMVLPEGFPENAFVYVFTKDWDHLWRQVRLPAPPQRGEPVVVSVPISGPEAAARWEPRGHERPWHQMTPGSLLEYGVALEQERQSFNGVALISSVWLEETTRNDRGKWVRGLNVQPRSPRVGERFEVTFSVDAPYNDPFSRDSVRIDATITPPSGPNQTVQGFYYEDFLYDPQIADKTRTLTPAGTPAFKVRYCPRVSGMHTVKIAVTVEGQAIGVPALTFHAQPPQPDYRGFVKRDPDDDKYLQWEDGTPFWGIGVNVRSPYDNRYLSVAPYSTWRNEGLPLYSRLFETYEQAGIDIIEVWMSSWWLALEWINDAPGFHGVGHYNQYRAWMLDHILEEAAKHNIAVILVMNNHGKFGALNDTEWERNPYNKANGGFLENCEHYFTDEKARALFRQKCDYVVARWAHAPNLLTWKLFTEIDLTGTSYDFYQKPPAAQWHKEMGSYLKEIDPYDHLITTHWMLGYHRINDAIALLPEMDFLTTDAYYQGGGTERLLAMLKGGNQFAEAKKKPLLITEYGGSPHADSMGNLIKQAHLGIWTGFFHEAPAAPMFWWFALVDEKKLYPFYTALRHFTDGEDRRGMVPAVVNVPKRPLVSNELRGDDRLFVWAFDSAFYLSDKENLTAVRYDDVSYTTKALKPGTYRVEFWNVAEGTVAESRTLTIGPDQSTITLSVPAFTRDFALKITPAEGRG